jgi:hypothetical protein
VVFIIEDEVDPDGKPTGNAKISTEGAVAVRGTAAEMIGYEIGVLLVEASGLDWSEVAVPLGKAENN